jgi:hypothetical protein
MKAEEKFELVPAGFRERKVTGTRTRAAMNRFKRQNVRQQSGTQRQKLCVRLKLLRLPKKKRPFS